MKQTAKYIARAVLFAALLVAILAALAPVFRPKYLTGGVPSTMEGDLDYLVWGDSEGWTAVAPMQLWRDHGFSGYTAAPSASVCRRITTIWRTSSPPGTRRSS